MRSTTILLPFLAAFSGILGVPGSVHGEEVEFPNDIKPVIEAHCFGCHGPEKQKSGLRLDSREAMLLGGSRGPALVPGDTVASLILQFTRPGGEIEMPPKGFLPTETVGLLAAWIQSGAAWPGAESSPSAREASTESVDTKESASAPIQTVNLSLHPSALILHPSSARAVPSPEINFSLDGSVVEFNREVRPILSEHCYACHGPDERVRKAGLRLDDGKGAYSELPSGHTAIVPGDLDAGELVRRILAHDPEDRMPPAEFDKPLNEGQRQTLVRWVAQGAEWQGHWSFIPPKRPAVPAVQRVEWPRSDIDRFILARLEREGLEPSPEADKERLIRRVTLDLTGLPPSLAEIDAFLADQSANAYEKVVDRLLASPRYGEHMARYWLDLARYADTNGYHIDNERHMWRWRDWVIDAFNRNLPYDRFSIEQLAGDLLPNPTTDQKLATGFNRNHMINFEGGAIPEEYHMQYVVDRVNTTSTVWMGLTAGCAQCHDHKYDPLSQREFYQLFDFFNQVSDKGLDGYSGNAVPFIKAPTSDQRSKLAVLRKKAERLESERNAPMPDLDAAQADWEAEWHAVAPALWQPVVPGLVEDQADEGDQGGGTTVLRSRLNLEGITAFRLEIRPTSGIEVPEDAAPFAIREITVEAGPTGLAGEPRKVQFEVLNLDGGRAEADAANVIDGKADTEWIPEGIGDFETRTVLLVPAAPVGEADGTELRIAIAHNRTSAFEQMGVFAVSVSTHPDFAPVEQESWHVSGPFTAKDGEEAFAKAFPPETGVDLDAVYADGRSKWVEARPALTEGKLHELPGDVGATYLYRRIESPTARDVTLGLGSSDGMKLWFNGEEVFRSDATRKAAANQNQITLRFDKGRNELLMKIASHGDGHAFYYNLNNQAAGPMPFPLALAMEKDAEARSDAERMALRDYYRRENSPEWRARDKAHHEALAAVETFEEELPTAMVMDTVEERRETFVMTRGQYEQPGEKVSAATPAFLPPMEDDAPRNRLGLAQWLLDSDHPLTARVAANRQWHRFFGTGIVKTTEDFGIQGEWPSHPELLDWLATEFVRIGWDMKALQKLIVTSATYRQSSQTTPALLRKDPDNRLLARGPRYRLDAETVRDNALAVSGLLAGDIGGPSVRPYQPAGIWEEVAYGAKYTAQRFKQDEGDANYRRSMYTFWKRQAPPPNLVLFDAPNREVCTAQRERTNTPLQALALMNDQQFVEASRAFADRILDQDAMDLDARIDYAFRAATARWPGPEEHAILEALYEDQRAEFADDADAARALIEVGATKPADDHDPAEWAAWTLVANTILNMDEVINRN